ncbi:hypothetical protein B0F90DRAFT_1775159 [Multifurca ochricompacta]|uniref:Uncharacterized protein n=1 Tax=Multifurca ochricompacta TaxID=376703 RepID=A0AAD4LXN3_9AGAM|nr:hypothetical protein B0F90DRAFT_1775159 [Multifurca ochricompacta]
MIKGHMTGHGFESMSLQAEVVLCSESGSAGTVSGIPWVSATGTGGQVSGEKGDAAISTVAELVASGWGPGHTSHRHQVGSQGGKPRASG